VILGRLIPDYFPHIFGKSENEPLDLIATTIAFEKLAHSINSYLKETNANESMTIDEIAYGFVRVANEVILWP
jgi:5-oxoprolinase (ATP-hydrolysing)